MKALKKVHQTVVRGREVNRSVRITGEEEKVALEPRSLKNMRKHEAEECAKQGEVWLHAGEFKRLVQWLCWQGNPHYEAQTTQLLYCYRSFASPQQLLSVLQQVWESPSKHVRFGSTLSVSLTRQRVVHVASRWLTTGFADFSREDSVRASFIEWASKSFDARDWQPLQLTLLRKAAAPHANDFLSRPCEHVNEIRAGVEPLLLIAPEVLAHELYCLEYEVYSAVRPSELTNKNWNSVDAPLAPNVAALRRVFNQVSFFVASTVLCATSAEQQVLLARYFIDMAQQCRSSRDFNGMGAIFSGLQNTSVSRLKVIFKALEDDVVPRGRLAMHHFHEMEELLDVVSNFKGYREVLQATHSSSRCIPYIPLHLRDTLALHEREKDVTEEGLINFDKIRSVGGSIHSILRFCHSRAPRSKSRDARDFLLDSMAYATQDEMDQLSDEWKERDWELSFSSRMTGMQHEDLSLLQLSYDEQYTLCVLPKNLDTAMLRQVAEAHAGPHISLTFISGSTLSPVNDDTLEELFSTDDLPIVYVSGSRGESDRSSTGVSEDSAEGSPRSSGRFRRASAAGTPSGYRKNSVGPASAPVTPRTDRVRNKLSSSPLGSPRSSPLHSPKRRASLGTRRNKLNFIRLLVSMSGSPTQVSIAVDIKLEELLDVLRTTMLGDQGRPPSLRHTDTGDALETDAQWRKLLKKNKKAPIISLELVK